MRCLTTWTFFLRSGFAHVDNVITSQCSKQSHGCSCQGCRAGTLWNLPNPASEPTPEATEPSGTCLRNLHQHAPELSGTCRYPPEPPEPSGTLRKLPELASGTYTSTRRNLPELSEILRNLHQPQNSPELSGTLWNSPEPSGTCLWNLHQHTPEPSGTSLRNLLLQPAPAHTGAYLG